MPTPPFILSFFSLSILTVTAQTLITPIAKDNSTLLYTLSIYLKTPLRPSKLHLDLGSYFTWLDCRRHYTSTSYRPVYSNSTLCNEIIPAGIGYCYLPPGPACFNNSCLFSPENPLTRETAGAVLLIDKFGLSTPANKPGPVSDLVFSCTQPNQYAKILRGLARGSAGLAAMGRYNHSLPAQVSSSFSLPQIFAICLPSSSAAPGLAWFGTPGPYYFGPGVEDLSKSLNYTKILTAPRGSDTQVYYFFESPEYYIALTSIRVNGKSIPLNKTLLDFNELGLGGVKLSSSRPYSVLQSSIFRSLTDAFEKEARGFNLTVIAEPGVEPFKMCFTVEGSGPAAFPTIDLVLENGRIIWRIYGWNSMVRVSVNNAEAWCLGFVDGGDDPRTTMVVGAHQLQDNLLQFDLERGRLGFSSSLLVLGTSCSDFKLGSN